jgi:DNA polymerase III epsilon subunit-like protein
VFVNQKQAILPDGSVKASHIHNISKSMILKGESPTAAFEAFNAFISDATSYVAHNVDFDIGKIKHNFKEASVSVDISSKLEFDSVVLAQESFYKFTANRKSLKLTDLSRDLKVNVDTTGLSADAANAHRADYDSRMLQGVLQKLYESHKQSGAFTTTLDPSREQILQKVSKSLLALYPDTNPMLAIKDLLYAQEASSGSLGITNKPIISTSNKASTLFNFDSASTAVDNVLMSMMANVANKDGIEQVLASISSTANTNANVTNTLFALAQQFSGSKGLANMDRVVADAMTLAVFSEALEVYGHEITLDKQHGDAALLYRDEEQDMVNEARRNLIVGEKVQQLLSIPVSDPEISAALGAIATTAVASALQVNEQGEGSFGVNSNLTPSGRVFGYQLAPLSQALLGTKADKDHYRSNKISEKDWNSRNRYIKATRIKGSAPADVFAHVYDKLGHDDQWQRDALLELSNMGFRWDTDLFMNMDQLIDNEGFNGLLKIRGYTDAEGNEAKGSFNNGRNAYIDATDNDGRVIPKIKALELIHQSLKAGHQAGTLNPKETKEYWETQKHVYDPNSTDPIYNRANVQEAYHGDKLKDMNLQRLMSMVVPKDENGQWKTKTDQNGKASQVKFGGTFYTDWFMGLNGRFYMKQYIGNFQSSKAARGGIMADEDAVYNSQEDIMELKAGVMKKFGGEYSKMGVEEAASHFAKYAKEWHGLMYPSGASSQDWSANADAILKIANNEEKFLSLSAMREGARLWQEYGVDVDGKRDNTTNMADIANISSRTNRKAIKSKFFTEVDGVANGTAHNAMQAGSFEAAAATNLNPLIALNSELFEHKKGREGEDIYAISGMALMESIKQSGNLVLVDLFDKLGMDSAKRRDFMKKPVMIFAYGAGQITIKKSVREGLEELFDQDGVRDKLTTALNVHLDTGTLVLPEKQSGLEWLIDQIGTQVNSAVATKFEAITQITGLLSQLASAAVEQGITPSLRMPNGNVIIFGMQYQKARSVTKSKEDLVNAKRDVANAQRKYDKAVQDGAPNKVQSEARATLQTAIAKAKLVESRLDFNDAPLYVVDTTFHTDARVANRPNGNQYQIDPVYYKAHMTDADMKDAILKAATQAAVLITHNLDATNMLQGIMNARKPGKLGSAAQVFDGIFMTPKDARTYSKHLNKEFFRIHNEFHYIDQFKRDLESLVEGDNSQFDKRGMQGIRAMLHKIEKAVAAHKKLLRHFEFGDRFIHQFFWDGATAVDKQFVVDSIAKAKKANKRLYSLDSSDDEGGRLRGKNANKLPDEFFDQFDTNNAYLADLDNRLTTTAK